MAVRRRLSFLINPRPPYALLEWGERSGNLAGTPSKHANKEVRAQARTCRSNTAELPHDFLCRSTTNVGHRCAARSITLRISPLGHSSGGGVAHASR